MSTTTTRVLLATAGTAAAVYFAYERRRRNRTAMERTKRYVRQLGGNAKDVAGAVGDSAMTVLSKSRSEARKRQKTLLKSLGAGLEASLKTWHSVTD